MGVESRSEHTSERGFSTTARSRRLEARPYLEPRSEPPIAGTEAWRVRQLIQPMCTAQHAQQAAVGQSLVWRPSHPNLPLPLQEHASSTISASNFPVMQNFEQPVNFCRQFVFNISKLLFAYCRVLKLISNQNCFHLRTMSEKLPRKRQGPHMRGQKGQKGISRRKQRRNTASVSHASAMRQPRRVRARLGHAPHQRAGWVAYAAGEPRSKPCPCLPLPLLVHNREPAIVQARRTYSAFLKTHTP